MCMCVRVYSLNTVLQPVLVCIRPRNLAIRQKRQIDQVPEKTGID